ncbi:MAG: NAD(P)/FAD-dependent oxidoreductase [Thermomicrobiales bacterium]
MDVDVTVVGSGPNGLAAAVIAARAGLSVRVIERAERPGGGLRSANLTLPGFHHDVCSAVHPMALASPFFRAWALERRVEMIVPAASYAHPLDHGRAGIAWRDLDRTVVSLGADGPAWRRLVSPLLDHLDAVVALTSDTLLQRPAHLGTMMRLGLRTLAEGGRGWMLPFSGEVAPALFTGVAAHVAGMHPSLATAAAGLVLATHGHGGGWPIPAGGSQAIADALIADLVAHGGRVVLGVEVQDLAEVAGSRAVVLDVGVPGLRAIAGDRLPARYVRALDRYRFGAGVCKVDFALSAPVPWTHPEIAAAGTVHLGGTRGEIATAENAVQAGRHPDSPYVLVTQPSRFDPSRAPDGQHILWAYTHVPPGRGEDRTEAIVRQIERFAPGFRETILARHTTLATDLASANPNLVGGDIGAGEVSLLQLVKRPVLARAPWRTPIPRVYLCSAATPPGPAVHGMGGFHAMHLALREVFGIETMPHLAS